MASCKLNAILDCDYSQEAVLADIPPTDPLAAWDGLSAGFQITKKRVCGFTYLGRLSKWCLMIVEMPDPKMVDTYGSMILVGAWR